MQPARPRFSFSVYFYLVVFFLLLALLPICLTATIENLAKLPAYWFASLVWPIALVGFAVYADRRCSSDRMRFRDGLLWVTASMMTGWVYMSFATVFPVLLFAFWASVFFALSGDMRGKPGYSQTEWHRLVSHLYRHRMRQ
jgi:hypothetical protein